MPESKFFVWARGRWRELCLASGRVHGAEGPVRFLYVRGTRLEAARAPRVLRALRALAAGQTAAARDGAPLPQRRRGRRAHRSRSHRRHHCCARHSQCNTSLVETPRPLVSTPPPAAARPPRADAAIQATEPASPARFQPAQQSSLQSPRAETAQVPPQPRDPPRAAPRKRKRSDTSTEGISLGAFKRREFCKELLINEDDADLFREYLINNDPELDLYRFDTDEAYKMQFFYRINPLVDLPTCRQLEALLRRRASQDSISLKDFATKLGLRSISDQESEKSKRYKMRRRTKAIVVSSTSTSVSSKSTTSASSTTSDNDSDDDKENFVQNRRTLIPASHKQKDFNEQKKNKDSNKNDTPSRESRRTVENKSKSDETPADKTLRKRLMVAAVQRNINNMNKDEDDKVTNNRRKDSPSVKEDTRKDTPTNEQTDEPLVDRLRKRSMGPSSDDKNTNLDKSVDKSNTSKNDKKNVDNGKSNDRNENKSVEKNNNNLPKSHKKGANKSDTAKDVKSVNNKKVDAVVVSSSTSSSDSSYLTSRSKPYFKRFFTKKKPVPKLSAGKLVSQTSKRTSTSVGSKKCGGGREYVPLEDHAIVAFVSGGDRARRVNGNLIWRELQEQFHRLTGLSRSWHSLRNRYLRYLLPSLGQMALGPQQAARLRAAAAKGEIKRKFHSPAPNPLCVVPKVRSAFAAGASSRSNPSSTPSPPPPPPTRPSPQERARARRRDNTSPSPPRKPSVPPSTQKRVSKVSGRDNASPSRSSTPQKPSALPSTAERALRARKKENTDTPPAAPPRRPLRSSGVLPPASPSKAPSKPPTASVRPRMRKLFNHNAHTMR